MKIYISIPITGKDLDMQKAKATEIAKRLSSLGYQVVNPFNTPAPPDYYNDRRKYAYYMGEDFKKLLTCEAIYMCNGWQYSKGCRMEHAADKIMKLSIFVERKQPL